MNNPARSNPAKRTDGLEIAYVEIGFANTSKRRGRGQNGMLGPVHMRHRIWKRRQVVEAFLEWPNGELQEHEIMSLEAYETFLLSVHSEEPTDG